MCRTYNISPVVFLDILGTKDRKNFEEKFRVHQLFHQEMALNQERQKQLSHVIYKRLLRSFSDCVFIFYTYKEGVEDSRKNDNALMYVCLYNISISILRILNAGYLVRGGATFGECFIDELGFFGPAVEESYLLESKYAIFPRIILSDYIGQKIFDYESSLELEYDNAAKAMFSALPRLIHKDKDEKFFLNIFYELEKTGIVKFREESIELEKLKKAITERIDIEISNEGIDPRIVPKLNWMREFVANASLRLKPEFSQGITIVL